MTICKKLLYRNPLGLHARPASLWVSQTAQFECEIRIYKGSYEADGRSAISLMLLDIVEGDELLVCMDGLDEIKAMHCFELWLQQL